jgi:hypothetical protein
MDYPRERLEVMLQYKPQSMIQKVNLRSLNGPRSRPCLVILDRKQVFSACPGYKQTHNPHLSV